MTAALALDLPTWTPPRTPLRRAGGKPTIEPPLAVVLRIHRTCAPEHRDIVLRECLRDRSVLPRYHQEDRGRANAVRGIHVAAPEGAYARIPVWTSRAHWLQIVVPAVLAANEPLRKKMRVSAELVHQWARVKSGYAEARTGRRCIVRPMTLASVLGVTERHVERLNAFARKVGLEKVVLEGRMLNVDEVVHCRQRGSRQRGLATEVALAAPSNLFPQEMNCDPSWVTPSSGTDASLNTNCKTSSLHGLTAKKKEPAPPARRQKRPRSRHPAMKLARELSTKLAWLSGEQPGRLAPALTRFAAAGWTADDVIIALADADKRRQIASPTAATIRTRPAIVLASILRQLDTDTDQPSKYDPEVVMPCNHPDCDGHGWRSTWDEQGNESVHRCPTCPPRRDHHSPTEPAFSRPIGGSQPPPAA